MRFSDSASVPSSSSPSFSARAVRSQSETRPATALISVSGRSMSRWVSHQRSPQR